LVDAEEFDDVCVVLVNVDHLTVGMSRHKIKPKRPDPHNINPMSAPDTTHPGLVSERD
jgi:hypothetical protein